MKTSFRLVSALAAPTLALCATLAAPRHDAGTEGSTAPLPHPHFQKKLECQVSRGLTLTVQYQTVT